MSVIERKPVSSSPESPPGGNCNLCGGPSSLVCPSCDNQPLCDACDDLFHRHPSRANHKRDKIPKTKQGASRRSEPRRDCPLVFIFILFFFVYTEICSICGIAPVDAQCSTCVQRLCQKCDMLYHSHPDRKGHQRTITAPAKTSRSGQVTFTVWFSVFQQQQQHQVKARVPQRDTPATTFHDSVVFISCVLLVKSP